MPVQSGFSAIELLVVAGIVSLLVAIAVPNFIDAKVRAELADVRATLQQTENAIIQYRVDYNRIPERNPNNPFSSEQPLRQIVSSKAVLTEMPIDRFKAGVKDVFASPLYAEEYITYDNLSTVHSQNLYVKVMRRDRFDSFMPKRNGSQWVLKSIGPDQTDYQDEGLGRNTGIPNLSGSLTLYDTSNGIFSLGEIVKPYLGN